MICDIVPFYNVQKRFIKNDLWPDVFGPNRLIIVKNEEMLPEWTLAKQKKHR